MAADDSVALEFPELPAPSCANCGFLGKPWARDGESGWLPFTRFERESGWRDGDPACWRNQRSLRDDIVPASGLPATSPGAVNIDKWLVDVIQRARPECETRFHPWVPHWTAEKHLEEHKMHLVEKQRREWERSFTGHWLPLLIAVFSIVVSALIGLLAAAIEAGWIDRPW